MPSPRIKIDVSERRARLARRHRLAPPHRAQDVVEASRSVVCLHATDPSTVYLSAWARAHEMSIDEMDRALYDDRKLIRMLIMRRTMFVVPAEDVSVFRSATSRKLLRTERRRNRQLVEMLGVKDVDGWIRDAESATLAALERRGEATARELSSEVPALQEKVRVNVGKRYESSLGMSGRILLVLALEGKVVRARPRGSWVSSQYRWALMSGWLGRELEEISEPDATEMIVRRWLERFGPGTELDLRWWTGWTAGRIRKALAAVKAVEVDLDGKTGYVLPNDLTPTREPEPWVALLPSLDPTTMGWKNRDWYLQEHQDVLFDSNGNAGQTIWMNGRIVGGWAARKNGEVVTRLLEDVGSEAEQAVEAESARLSEWLEATHVVPRFPTPLQKELIG